MFMEMMCRLACTWHMIAEVVLHVRVCGMVFRVCWCYGHHGWALCAPKTLLCSITTFIEQMGCIWVCPCAEMGYFGQIGEFAENA